MRITANPPSPSGVAIAAMVSSSMDSVPVEKFAQMGKCQFAAWGNDSCTSRTLPGGWLFSPKKPEDGECNNDKYTIPERGNAHPLLGGEGRGEGERPSN